MIRPYRQSDRNDVADICLKTGLQGADATGVYISDELLPDVYVLPYVDSEPELAFVIDTGERAAGYIVATANTARFVERLKAQYLPLFTEKYAQFTAIDEVSAEIIDSVINPEHLLIPELTAYPAHLHIDLLPEIQSQGFGRRLMRTLLAALSEHGVPGVHLGVSPCNTSAQAFYARLGFEPLRPHETNGSLWGISTSAGV